MAYGEVRKIELFFLLKNISGLFSGLSSGLSGCPISPTPSRPPKHEAYVHYELDGGDNIRLPFPESHSFLLHRPTQYYMFLSW